MKLFGQLVRTAVNIATVSIAITKDVLTLGGIITGKDQPYTAKALQRLKDEAEEDD